MSVRIIKLTEREVEFVRRALETMREDTLWHSDCKSDLNEAAEMAIVIQKLDDSSDDSSDDD